MQMAMIDMNQDIRLVLDQALILLCPFGVQKKDVRVGSMGNSVNIVMVLLGLIFVCSKPKIGSLSSIINRLLRWSPFGVQ